MYPAKYRIEPIHRISGFRWPGTIKKLRLISDCDAYSVSWFFPLSWIFPKKSRYSYPAFDWFVDWRVPCDECIWFGADIYSRFPGYFSRLTLMTQDEVNRLSDGRPVTRKHLFFAGHEVEMPKPHWGLGDKIRLYSVERWLLAAIWGQPSSVIKLVPLQPV